MTRFRQSNAAVVAAMLACLGASKAACNVALPAAHIAIHSDAVNTWAALGRPTEGVHLRDGWIISCYRQPIDPASSGFESVEMAACKQEAILQLVVRCTGDGAIADTLSPALRELVESAFLNWCGGRVQTSGAIWIAADRQSGHDLAVLALPESACTALPKRVDWRLNARELASESKSWILVAAIAESAAPSDTAALRALIAERLRGAVVAMDAAWPPAFVKVPDLIPESQLEELGLGEVALLAAMRPGDGGLWRALAERCSKAGLAFAAAEIRGMAVTLGWPRPAVAVEPERWSAVEVGDLPPALVAVVRHAGSIPAKPAPKGDAERRASDAFFAKEPRLDDAEAWAREACAKPSPDGLNLLAAIRLADAVATRHTLMQALAFSTQAVSLEAEHPYARINAARSMQRLGWKAEVKAALALLPPAQGAWQQREIDQMTIWAQEP